MDFLATEFLSQPISMWLIFASIIVTLLVLDLGVLHRTEREISVKESLLMCGFYVFISLCFGAFVWTDMGHEAGLQFLTGYVVEQSLALDNIFVMALIFGYFNIPRMYQHRVLFWGIIGVLVLRGIMIVLGAALVHQFEWVLLLFAGFLVFTGIKMLFHSDDEPKDLADNTAVILLRRWLPVTHDLHGHSFFVRQTNPKTGRKSLFVTPLFLCLLLIELADVVFAVDSVPAIFAITTDPYIVFTSNIFACLGLRSLYFALSAMLERFAYLKYALAGVLVFIGGKVLAAEFLGIAKIPPALSLGVTVVILASGFFYSMWKTRKA